MNIHKKSIIFVIIGFIAVIALTVLALNFFVPHDVAPVEKKSPVQTAKNTATLFQQQVDASKLLPGAPLTAVPSASQSPMYIRDTTLNKYLAVDASQSITVSSTKAFSKDELATITSNTKQLFTQQNMTSSQTTASPTILLSSNSTDVSCQLETLSPASQPTTQLKLACVDQSSYKETVKTVNQLIGLWSAHSSTPYELLTETTTTAGVATITILQAMPRDMSSAHILVFAKGNSDWKYIGDASQGTSTIPSDKYIINKDIQAAFDNAQYGQLLKRVLTTSGTDGK